MNFRIADTFTDSLTRLTGDEQKAVKTTAFDLQMNTANTGMSFHKLDRSKDKRFWSVRVSSDIRLIVHKTHFSLMLCFPTEFLLNGWKMLSLPMRTLYWRSLIVCQRKPQKLC